MQTETTNGQRLTFHRLTADSNPRIFDVLSELDKRCVGTDGWSAESFRSEAAKDNGIVICCYSGMSVAGLICGFFAGEQADISSVAVHPEHRRQGIATQLIRLFEETLPDITESIFLEVRESNESARQLYKSSGFEDLSVRKNFYINPREDAIVMKKDVLRNNI